MDRVQTFKVFRAGNYCPSLDLALASARDAHLLLQGVWQDQPSGGRILSAMDAIGTTAVALNQFQSAVH